MLSVALLSKFAIEPQLEVAAHHVGHIPSFISGTSVVPRTSRVPRSAVGIVRLVRLIGLIGLVVPWVFVVVGRVVLRVVRVGISVVRRTTGPVVVMLEWSSGLRVGHFSRRMVVCTVSLCEVSAICAESAGSLSLH